MQVGHIGKWVKRRHAAALHAWRSGVWGQVGVMRGVRIVVVVKERSRQRRWGLMRQCYVVRARVCLRGSREPQHVVRHP